MSLKLLKSPSFSTLTLMICALVMMSGCAGYIHQNQTELASIEVSAANTTIAVGATQQATATGHFSDGSTQDLTAGAAWSSQNSSVATISGAGMITARAAGTTLITASSGTVSGSMTFTVSAPTLRSLAVTPANPSLAKNATQQFTATGTFSDGSTQSLTGSVAWSSGTSSVATITSGGLATAIGAGTSIIQAVSGGVMGSTILSVAGPTLTSIAVTPASPTITEGATEQFTATGTFSDNSTQNITSSVNWLSLTTGVATISSAGLAKGVGAGSSTIQATSGTVTGSTVLSISAATLTSIAVTPANPTIAKGATQQFTATGTFSDSSTRNITGSVTWSSQTTSVATISGAGLGQGVGVGSSMIQATSGAVTGSTVLNISAATLKSIAVTPATPSIAVGATQQFTATGTFSDASTQNLAGSVTWNSLNTAVATISTSGLASGISAGSASIKASSGSVTGSTTLTVNAVAPVLTSIAVTPANPSIQNGATQQFTATGTYSNASAKNITSTVTWSSLSTGVATISSAGLATAVGTGSSTIQAALGAVDGSTVLTVTVSTSTLQVLVVSPQNPLITDAGSTQAFTATGHYSDGSTQDLTNTATWTSSNTGVAAVNSGGSATSASLPAGQTAGYASIKAAVGAISGVSILSVSNHTTNVSGFAGVFTQHNDNLRTGQNQNETVLTPAVVKTTAAFGKKFSQAVDGYVYAQPLYEPGVNIGGAVHNVVFVATENDSLYAFDADSNAGANANPLWHANLIDTAHGAAAGATPVTNNQVGCGDLVPKIGITSTPVIDPSTGTIYVETKSSEGSNIPHRLHAIDITTGNEKFSGPTVISASVSVPGGTVSFDGLHHMNRPGLLWLNGVIYLAYASHCDNTPYHGWLFAYDAATLTQKAAYLSTPEASNGGLAGFWMSGAGVAADSSANIFITTGNGDFDTTNIPAKLLGDSVLKLFFNGSALSLSDYFTPYNQGSLDGGDTDLGSGGTLVLPDQPGSNPHELVQVGKSGTIYVINRDQFTVGNLHYCKTNCNNMDAQIAQELPGAVGGLWSMPAYWNGTVFFQGAGDSLKSFLLTNGVFPTSATASTTSTTGYPGATPSISSSGNSNGIVWEIGGSGLLAFDPANALAPLYNSANQGSRDTAGAYVKFSVPTIANGKVFVGTQTELDVYGTLP